MDSSQRQLTNLSLVQKEVSFDVEASHEGMRIDRFLHKRLGWLTRAALKEISQAGRLLRNGSPVPCGRKIKANDTVTLVYPEPEEDLQEMDRISWETLYEDKALLVIHKPPHVIVHPAGGYRYTTLLNALHKKYLGDKSELREEDPIPRLVHRIDKDTSGVLVITFQRHTHSVLGKLFEEHSESVQKNYLALVEGRVPWSHQEIRLPIEAAKNDPIRLKRQIADKGSGQLAHTSVNLVERFERFSLVQCKLHTGRQHQIRVHMQALGHPLVGDHLYGLRDELREIDIRNPDYPKFRFENIYFGEKLTNKEASKRIRELDAQRRHEYRLIEAGEPIMRGEKQGRLLISRCALHCSQMSFPHPLTQAKLSIKAPLPADFQLALSYLRKYQ